MLSKLKTTSVRKLKATDYKKIFVNYISSKELVFKTCKNLLKLSHKSNQKMGKRHEETFQEKGHTHKNEHMKKGEEYKGR